LADLNLPEFDGLELLRRAKVIQPLTEVLILTGEGTVANARAALKAGAVDFITKPFSFAKDILPTIIRLLDCPVEHRVEKDEIAAPLIGGAESQKHLLFKARKIAASDFPVLITGESGTGKEVMAEYVHHHSTRSAMPLIKINCAAIPENLLESELFGHVRGAFTGAFSNREGVFDAAEGATLLLDEIGEVAMALQPKLLRVLQDGSYSRVGAAEVTRHADVRIIAVTNANLTESIEKGIFRPDLYYRLAVVPLELPLLRERIGDLEQLLVDLLARDVATKDFTIAPETLRLFRDYAWPGNIRELWNVIRHGAVMAETTVIQPTDLPAWITYDASPLAEREAEGKWEGLTLDELEKRMITRTLARVDNNRTRAARLLGVTRRVLGYRIAKFGLDQDSLNDPQRPAIASVRSDRSKARASS
jgi:two-component system NtrC family response regulator